MYTDKSTWKPGDRVWITSYRNPGESYPVTILMPYQDEFSRQFWYDVFTDDGAEFSIEEKRILRRAPNRAPPEIDIFED